jgi:hypothetical protein
MGGIGADLVGQLGMDLLAESVGEFGKRLGATFVAMGGAFEVMASNPLALAAAGVTLIGASILLKKYLSRGGPGSSGAASTADAETATQIERLSGQFTEDPTRGPRTINARFGDREFAGAVVDTVNRAMDNGTLRMGFAREAFGEVL